MSNKLKQQINKAKRNGMTPLELAQVKAIAKKHADEVLLEANEKAFLQILAIPCMILCEDYWKKSAKQRVPKFIEDVAGLFVSYKEGIVTDQDLADAVYQYAGIQIEAEWLKSNERIKANEKEKSN